METLEFSAGLHLGIDLIDEQHAHFFELMKKMVAADEGGENRDLVVEVLDELSDYLDEHFRAEEELMARFGYPDLGEHHQQHVEFVRKVIDFNRQYRRGEIGLEMELMAFLVTWFTDHIRQEDPKYVALFQEHGV